MLPRYPPVVLLPLALVTMCRAQDLSPGDLSLEVSETSGVAGERLATVSLPFVRGEVPHPASARVVDGRGETTAAQCRVLNRHPDGSVRRALLRFPWAAEAGQVSRLTAVLSADPSDTRGLLSEVTPSSFTASLASRTVHADGSELVVARDGVPECRVSFSGVEFPRRFLGPEVEVIEDGPYFTWVGLTYFGGAWNVYVEVQADWRGRLRIVARLRLMRGEPGPVPLFGLQVNGLAPDLDADGSVPLPYEATVADGGPRRLTFGAAAPTLITIPDGAQVRHGRVRVEKADGAARFLLLRDASLDSTVGDEHKLFYEGQERHVEVVLPPPGRDELYCSTQVSAQRRSVAVLGEAPVNWGRLDFLRRQTSEHALKLRCRDGDQFGDVTSGVSQSGPRWSLTGLTRIDTGLDMLEDYYSGGDVRLRDMALDWAENWVCLKQYRGWDTNCYGGERYTMSAWKTIPSFNQKGIMMIARAYEETGDPRYLEATLAFADRIAKQLQTRYFLSGTAVSPSSIGGDANIRPGFLGLDLVDLYHWTGRREYLDAAVRIIHGLGHLRTGDYGLLREGYGDPFSPFERLVTGTDLGVTEDNSDHLKPFILNYILEGAQAVYAETEDPVAQQTMLSVSQFMMDARQPGGIFNYAQRHAACGNSVGHMSAEIARTLLRSYTLTGDERYRDAALETYHLLCKILQTYGGQMGGVQPPADRSYFYPDDRCELDFYRGEVSLGSVSRDETAYFLSAVNRILRIDPNAGEYLLSAPTHPRHKWLVEQVPVSVGPLQHEIGNCYIATLNLGKDGDQESGGTSDLVLLEDGRPLGPPHSLHADIREQGEGRYSHWTRNSLYLSAGDNSDPRTNGRTYTCYFGSPQQPPAPEQMLTIVDGKSALSARRPHPAVAQYARGLQAEREGRWQDAIAVWEQVLADRPDSSPELYRQIALWERAGNEAKALETCRRFVEAFPEHDRTPWLTMKLARHAIEAGDTGQARSILQQAAEQYAGTPWGEEAAMKLWHELGVGERPPTAVVATLGDEPVAAPVATLRAADGAEVAPPMQIGAAFDDNALHLTLRMPLGGPWPSAEATETVRVFIDARGEMTDYQVFIVDSTGSTQERGPMWHNRGQGFVPGWGWTADVTREAEGWTAELSLPFDKIGFRPGPGARTWRFGYRWDSLQGQRFWRPSNTYVTRPHDCGWLAFE